MKHSALRKFAAAAVLAVSFTGLSMVSASAAEPAPAPAVKVTAGHDQLGSFAPEFAHLNDDVLFGEVWSRTDKLPAKIRSIVTVTSLVSSGVLDSSLKFHIMKAKENGVTKEEMAEILTQTAFYFTCQTNRGILALEQSSEHFKGKGSGSPVEETTLSGIKETLKRAGATKEEVRDYLALTEPEARKQLLYRIRRKAFDECHEKQKTLDELDFLIYREDKS